MAIAIERRLKVVPILPKSGVFLKKPHLQELLPQELDFKRGVLKRKPAIFFINDLLSFRTIRPSDFPS
jgi:hypothetical protein